MKRFVLRVVLALAGGVLAAPAESALSCTAPVSSGFSVTYAPGAGNLVAQGTVSFTCTRTAAGDPTSGHVAADRGSNSQGSQPRARLGATTSYLSYTAYRDSGCGSAWQSNNVNQGIDFNLAAVTGPQPVTVSFWACVPRGQGNPAVGSYGDTVSMTVRQGNTTLSTGQFSAQIIATSSCTISTAPGTLAMSYTAFSATPATGSTVFAVTCSTGTSYGMTLDAYAQVLAGLRYTLSVNGVAAPGPATATGTGVPQAHTINGSIEAGQAGQCGSGTCTGTRTHTLTVTY